MLYRAESGQLRMGKYLRTTDTWMLESLLPEMETSAGPAACVYDEDYLTVWAWSTESALSRHTRPLNSSWAEGWSRREAYQVEPVVPEGDFGVVHAGGYTTLL